jgi:hypothetical protein
MKGRDLGKMRNRWEDNIKRDLKRTGREDMDWIHLAQDRVQGRAVVKAVKNIRTP